MKGIYVDVKANPCQKSAGQMGAFVCFFFLCDDKKINIFGILINAYVLLASVCKIFSKIRYDKSKTFWFLSDKNSENTLKGLPWKFLNIHRLTLHKICKITGFHWPVFSWIRIESTIYDSVLLRENTGQWKPTFPHILCNENKMLGIKLFDRNTSFNFKKQAVLLIYTSGSSSSHKSLID